MQVESNRDPSKNPEPFSLYDFTFWSDVAEKPKPPGAAGAAMIELLDRNLLPAFVMDGPWLADLEMQGRGQKPPERLCFACADAILLAPYRVDQDHWAGFLIAKASAVGAVRQFHSESGQSVVLVIPDEIMTKRAFGAAIEGAVLSISVEREN